MTGARPPRNYTQLPRADLPLALAGVFGSLQVGAPLEFRTTRWPAGLLRDVVAGAGMSVTEITEIPRPRREPELVVRATRERTLADTVGSTMRILICGLNPSLYAADAGVGFARPGNRLWPAALAAGLVERDRDPTHALIAHGVGMTDLVKRATQAASELTSAEYEAGVGRVTRMVEWLQPGVICFVGLAGWRSAVDRAAQAGVQEQPLGGRPVYLMPSTSGLNAHSQHDDFVAHLRAARALADA